MPASDDHSSKPSADSLNTATPDTATTPSATEPSQSPSPNDGASLNPMDSYLKLVAGQRDKDKAAKTIVERRNRNIVFGPGEASKPSGNSR